jgi:hypothetical protein
LSRILKSWFDSYRNISVKMRLLSVEYHFNSNYVYLGSTFRAGKDCRDNVAVSVQNSAKKGMAGFDSSPCSPFTIIENGDFESDDIPEIRIDSSKVRELTVLSISSTKNMIDFTEILPLAVDEITKHNEWTFNPMRDTKLNEIQDALSGQIESLMPHSLLDLADHLVTFEKYDYAFFAYMETVSISVKLYEIDSKPEIAWLVHDGLLGIAKIILADSVEVSLDIFQYLATTFECDEAKSYLPMSRIQI